MESHPPIANDREKALLHHARKHQVPCMSSATEAYVLQHLMTYKPVSCLEIGSAVGRSTSRIAHTIDQWSGYLTSFEISHPSYRTAMYHLRKERLWNTTLYHMDILQSPLDLLISSPLQFVFIDGMKGEYAAYLNKILPYCAAHTTIICDDIVHYADKVAPVYDILNLQQLTYQSVKLNDGDGILLIQR